MRCALLTGRKANTAMSSLLLILLASLSTVHGSGLLRTFHEDQTLPDVRNLTQGEVFPCRCTMKKAQGAIVLNSLPSWSRISADPSDVNSNKFLAVFSVRRGILPRRKSCMCGVITDTNGPWYPSDGGMNGYSTWCVGLCGAQCGQDTIGLTDDPRRFSSLAIHDVCQAYIGSRASMLSLDGLTNVCSSEGLRGASAAAISILSPGNKCTDGAEPMDAVAS